MKHLLAVILWFMALGSVAEAQQQIPVMPPDTVWGRIGAGQVGPGGAIPFSTLAAAIAPLIIPPSGYTIKPVPGSATLDSTYCNNVVVLSTGPFSTLTVGPATSFTNPCWLRILNADPSSGRTMNISGLTNGGFNLGGCGFGNICPLQAVEYLGDGSTWKLLRNPGAWRPITPTSLFASTTGSDTNDCLSAATSCTLYTTCQARNSIDSSALLGGQSIVINIAAGTYATTFGSPAALCSILGNSGAFASGITTLQGAAPGTVVFNIPANQFGIFTKDLGELQIHNISFIGSGGVTAISGAQFSVVDVWDGVTFGNMGANSAALSFSQSASINLDGPLIHISDVGNGCWSGVNSTFAYLSSNANLNVAGGVSLVFDCGASMGQVFLNQGGFFRLINLGFSGTGLAGVSGIRMSLYNTQLGTVANGCVYTGNGLNLKDFGVPGNLNNAFPVGSCTDFPITAVLADLPTCVGGIAGRAYEVNDSSVNTWGTTYAAGGANQVTVRCNGTAYTVTSK